MFVRSLISYPNVRQRNSIVWERSSTKTRGRITLSGKRALKENIIYQALKERAVFMKRREGKVQVKERETLFGK